MTKVVDAICEKTGLPKEEVMKDYHLKVEEIKKLCPNLDEAKLKERAERGLMSYYRKIIQTGASVWIGYVVGYDDASDRQSNKKRKAEKAYRENKEEAIRNGLVDANGVALETKQDSKNYGQPIRSFISRSVYGVCYTKGKNPKKFVLTYTSDNLEKIPIPPIGKMVKFRARLNNNSPDDVYALNSMPDTKFEDTEDSSVPPFDTIITKLYSPVKDVTSVPIYSDIVFEGILDVLDIENSFGTKRLNVSPEVVNLDTPSVLVYMPRQFNFQAVAGLAEGAKVLVFGRMGPIKEDGSSVINGWGLWVFPDYRSNPTPEMKKEDAAKLW